jgi:membrane fusion protein (multidrug efflux system)
MTRLGFLWVATLVAVLLVAAAGYKLYGLDQAAQGGGFAPQTTPVAVEAVRQVEFADVVEALGTANANESVSITSKVTETVSRLAYESGEFVRAGDVLAELADAEEAANLTEARSTLEEAQRERARYNELESRGVASPQAIDQLDSSVDRARARVRTIEARLADRIVRAPFDGVVGLRQASPGMLARPGDVIATLDDVSVIKLDFTIPERFLSAVSPGSRLEAQAAAYPGETFFGEVSQIDSRVDPITRTATVRAIVDNADRRLYPGMLMVVGVVRDVRQSLAVPELAVVRQGDEAYVYIVEQGPRGAVAVRRGVTTGARRDGLVEISAGLEEGELVVAKGVHRVRDGAPVTVAGAAPADQVAAAGRGA